jgi:hypothetical protein
MPVDTHFIRRKIKLIQEDLSELDIKSLHKADPLFCYQVAKDSQLLYGDLTDFNEFKAYAFSYYFDSKDLFHLEKILIQKFQNYLNQKYAR